jgi:Zn-dependent protease
VFSVDLTIQAMVFRLLAGLLVITLQGAIIAAMAVMLGDKGPRYDGRLTLSPAAHVDLLGLAAIVVSGFGWGRPVSIDKAQLRHGAVSLVAIVLTSSLALLLLAWVLTLLVIPALTALPYTAGLTTAAFLRFAAPFCIWMALFSLLPLPPLAGAHFLNALGIRVPESVGLWVGGALLLASLFGITRLVLLPLFSLIGPIVMGAGAGP